MKRKEGCRRVGGAFLSGALLVASPAAAQHPMPGSTVVGETYRVELLGGLWNPTPSLVVTSAQLGIPGTPIDLVADLGVARERFREFRFVGRLARKHKLRVHYLPIRYSAETVLTRDLVFNGVRYRLGVPVNAGLTWRTWRVGYEYDVATRDRWFAGFILEAKYTDVEMRLDSPLAEEFARARGPIPAVGGIVRVYPASNAALTLELTGFKVPEQIDVDTRGQYLDADLYGTINFSRNFGLQIGYRSIDVSYLVEQDSGDLALKGFYYAAVVRF
jgi:hypothetical protein